MNIPSNEVMIKLANAPGLCSLEEIIEVEAWLKFFNEHLKAYKAVYGEPAGFSVDSLLDKIAYYSK